MKLFVTAEALGKLLVTVCDCAEALVKLFVTAEAVGKF